MAERLDAASLPPPLTIKLALTNDQCGGLIGKLGSVIVAVQQRFDVAIKAGSAESMFPGTMLRAVVLRGAGENLAACLAHVAKLLVVDGAHRASASAPTHVSPSLLLSSDVAGALAEEAEAIGGGPVPRMPRARPPAPPGA
jgi:hypothetical protein